MLAAAAVEQLELRQQVVQVLVETAQILAAVVLV
jgi:hypothetical protein